MATTKKTANNKSVKAVKTAAQAPKKAVGAVAKKATPAGKTVPAKKGKAPVKTEKVVKKAVAPKSAKTAAKPVAKPVSKSAAKSVAKVATTSKKAPPAKKTASAVKTVAKTKKEAPAAKVTPVKKAPVKPASKVPVPKVLPKVENKPQVAPAAAKETKLKKHSVKESISVAIKKPVKKKVAPLKEVKVPKTSVKTSKLYEPNYQPLEERKPEEGHNELMIRYSDAELDEFRGLINKKLADASREVAYLQGIITRKDDMGGDVDGRYMTMEDGTVSMEREQMSQMVSRQISFIDNLKKALIRIENKTYGVCRVTGRLIDKARLRAVPHATLSLEAKLGIVKPKEQN